MIREVVVVHLFCGLVIGVVMGLTGAGGALVAIPLFMQFLEQDLKEASVYSLVAVVIASLLNFVAQRASTQYTTAVIIVVSSALGSLLTAPFKEVLPSLTVAIILSVVSLYALYSVWVPVKISIPDSKRPKEKWVISILIGLVLGALTTFTGLGGGVLMLPIFLAVYRFSQPEAVATSLFSVGLSSLASLLVQVHKGADFKVDLGLGLLLVGILSSVFVLKLVVKKLSATTVTRSRQIIFTVVVILAMAKIF